MFPCTEKYTDSEDYIQNNNWLYKLHQQCWNKFKKNENFKKHDSSICYFIIRILIFDDEFVDISFYFWWWNIQYGETIDFLSSRDYLPTIKLITNK